MLSHEASIIATRERAEMKMIVFFIARKIVVDGARHSIKKRRAPESVQDSLGWNRPITGRQSKARLARSCEARQGAISEGINCEPSLRIPRLINEVQPLFSGSGSLPV